MQKGPEGDVSVTVNKTGNGSNTKCIHNIYKMWLLVRVFCAVHM